MISCKQSTKWLLQKQKGKLSVNQNLQLLSHMAICSLCRLFVKQNLFIDKAVIKSRDIELSDLTAAEKEELFLSVLNKQRPE